MDLRVDRTKFERDVLPKLKFYETSEGKRIQRYAPVEDIKYIWKWSEQLIFVMLSVMQFVPLERWCVWCDVWSVQVVFQFLPH